MAIDENKYNNPNLYPCDIMTAEEWLQDYLSRYTKEHPANADMAIMSGFFAGFKKRDIKAAKKVLGVKTSNNFDRGTRTTTEWYWYLPEADQ